MKQCNTICNQEKVDYYKNMSVLSPSNLYLNIIVEHILVSDENIYFWHILDDSSVLKLLILETSNSK